MASRLTDWSTQLDQACCCHAHADMLLEREPAAGSCGGGLRRGGQGGLLGPSKKGDEGEDGSVLRGVRRAESTCKSTFGY